MSLPETQSNVVTGELKVIAKIPKNSTYLWQILTSKQLEEEMWSKTHPGYVPAFKVVDPDGSGKAALFLYFANSCPLYSYDYNMGLLDQNLVETYCSKASVTAASIVKINSDGTASEVAGFSIDPFGKFDVAVKSIADSLCKAIGKDQCSGYNYTVSVDYFLKCDNTDSSEEEYDPLKCLRLVVYFYFSANYMDQNSSQPVTFVEKTAVITLRYEDGINSPNDILDKLSSQGIQIPDEYKQYVQVLLGNVRLSNLMVEGIYVADRYKPLTVDFFMQGTYMGEGLNRGLPYAFLVNRDIQTGQVSGMYIDLPSLTLSKEENESKAVVLFSIKGLFAPAPSDGSVPLIFVKNTETSDTNAELMFVDVKSAYKSSEDGMLHAMVYNVLVGGSKVIIDGIDNEFDYFTYSQKLLAVPAVDPRVAEITEPDVEGDVSSPCAKYYPKYATLTIGLPTASYYLPDISTVFTSETGEQIPLYNLLLEFRGSSAGGQDQGVMTQQALEKNFTYLVEKGVFTPNYFAGKYRGYVNSKSNIVVFTDGCISDENYFKEFNSSDELQLYEAEQTIGKAVENACNYNPDAPSPTVYVYRPPEGYTLVSFFNQAPGPMYVFGENDQEFVMMSFMPDEAYQYFNELFNEVPQPLCCPESPLSVTFFTTWLKLKEDVLQQYEQSEKESTSSSESETPSSTSTEETNTSSEENEPAASTTTEKTSTSTSATSEESNTSSESEESSSSTAEEEQQQEESETATASTNEETAAAEEEAQESETNQTVQVSSGTEAEQTSSTSTSVGNTPEEEAAEEEKEESLIDKVKDYVERNPLYLVGLLIALGLAAVGVTRLTKKK